MQETVAEEEVGLLNEEATKEEQSQIKEEEEQKQCHMNEEEQSQETQVAYLFSFLLSGIFSLVAGSCRFFSLVL